MEWIILLLNSIVLFIFGLFIKLYLPSYMLEKGKNGVCQYSCRIF